MITWVSECIKKVTQNTPINSLKNDLNESLAILIEKKSFTRSKLSEISHVSLSLTQDSFTNNDVFLKIIQALAIKGFSENLDLKCFLHLVRITSTFLSNSELIMAFSIYLSSVSTTISTFETVHCLEQYFHHIESIVLGCNLPELKYHLSILEKIDKRVKNYITKYASECISKVQKAVSSRDLVIEQELFVILNYFFLNITKVFPESLSAFNSKFVIYSVLLLSPSSLALVSKYYPDEFTNLNMNSLQQSSISFRTCINSVMNGIDAIQKYATTSFKSEMKKNQQFMLYLKSLAQTTLFWENIDSLFLWDISIELTAWLIETKVTSKELYHSISCAIRSWGCFLSGSQQCYVSKECISNFDSPKILNNKSNQDLLLGLGKYLEMLWMTNFNDCVSRENIIVGIIRLYKHSSFKFDLSPSFSNLLLQLHVHSSKRIRNSKQDSYPYFYLERICTESKEGSRKKGRKVCNGGSTKV